MDTRLGSRKRLPLYIVFVISILVSFTIGSFVLIGLAWFELGSTNAAWAFVRGEKLLLEPANFQLGSIHESEDRVLKLKITNLTGRQISVYGLESFCRRDGCIESKDILPHTILPWKSQTLNINFRGPESSNQNTYSLATKLFSNIGTLDIFVKVDSVIAGLDSIIQHKD